MTRTGDSRRFRLVQPTAFASQASEVLLHEPGAPALLSVLARSQESATAPLGIAPLAEAL
jgi:hypothetical protein